MKKRFVFWYLAACAAGVGLHFLYGLWPNRLTMLLAPVQESVWEHLKLLYWPFLLAMTPLLAGAADRLAFWGAAMAGLLVMPVLLLSAFYVLSGAFGIERPAVDIVLYFAVMGAGVGTAWRLRRSGTIRRCAGILTMVAGLYGLMLVLFSLAAPQLPIFLPKI